MQILMIGRGVLPVGRRSGGAEHVCYELARHLASDGNDVTLVSDVDPSLLEDAPEHLCITGVGARLASSPHAGRSRGFFPRWLLQHLVGNVRAARTAWALIDEHPEFDVVHSHGALATLLLASRLRAGGRTVPLLYTEHDATPWTCRYRRGIERVVRRCVYRQLNLRACRAATAVVTNFPALADELAEKSHTDASRFLTVPNGADEEADPTTRGDLDLGSYLLFVGSLVDRKGPDLLLRAAATLAVPVVVVGEGPLIGALVALARDLHMDDRVEFVGAVDPEDVATYYRGARALVLPSVSEGVPLVALEALRLGCPVVASDVGGIATVICHGDNGLLVAPGDLAGLRCALASLDEDTGLLARLRDGAEASSRALLSWAAVAGRFEDVYGQLGARYGGRDTISVEELRRAPVTWLTDVIELPWGCADAQSWMRAA